jgi:hypothetical protein
MVAVSCNYVQFKAVNVRFSGRFFINLGRSHPIASNWTMRHGHTICKATTRSAYAHECITVKSKYTLNYLDGIGFGLWPRSGLMTWRSVRLEAMELRAGFRVPLILACASVLLLAVIFVGLNSGVTRSRGKSRGSCRRERLFETAAAGGWLRRRIRTAAPWRLSSHYTGSLNNTRWASFSFAWQSNPTVFRPNVRDARMGRAVTDKSLKSIHTPWSSSAYKDYYKNKSNIQIFQHLGQMWCSSALHWMSVFFAGTTHDRLL